MSELCAIRIDKYVILTPLNKSHEAEPRDCGDITSIMKIMIKIKKTLLKVITYLSILLFVLFFQEYITFKRKNSGKDFKKEILAEEYKGIIIEKYNTRTATLQIKINQIIMRRGFVTPEVYNLSNIGDTIIKIKNLNKCYLIHNGKKVYLNYTYYEPASFNERD